MRHALSAARPPGKQLVSPQPWCHGLVIWPYCPVGLSGVVGETEQRDQTSRRDPLSMKDDVPRLERYLHKLFGNQNLRVVMHPRKTDMAEISIGDEFIGPVYREEEDGEISYQLQIAILDIDLEEA